MEHLLRFLFYAVLHVYNYTAIAKLLRVYGVLFILFAAAGLISLARAASAVL